MFEFQTQRARMRFQLATDLAALTAYLPNFLALVGGDRWKRRAAQLARDAMESPFHAKIVADYHWLELALSEQMITNEALGRLVPDCLDLRTLAALRFAGMVVEVYGRLSAVGRTALEGRLRDALKADTGFASLYLEMDMALRLLGEGFDVEFRDLEGTARYDLWFAKGTTTGEIECKSLSADAGRKIHRKDFYRFIDAVGSQIAERAATGANEVLLITLDGRLPADTSSQKALRAATARILAEPGTDRVNGAFFTILRENYAKSPGAAPRTSARDFYKACCDAYGKNCHVSGAMTSDAGCLVVMRSRQEDDHSKPLLEALKKAAAQLSGERAGFIAVQFDDIEPEDLMLPHLRQRVGFLSYYVFHECPAAHVAGTYFCVYGGLSGSPEGIGAPAFAIPNPKFGLERDENLRFLTGLPDAEFAGLLGAPPPAESTSFMPFDSKGAYKSEGCSLGPGSRRGPVSARSTAPTRPTSKPPCAGPAIVSVHRLHLHPWHPLAVGHGRARLRRAPGGFRPPRRPCRLPRRPPRAVRSRGPAGRPASPRRRRRSCAR